MRVWQLLKTAAVALSAGVIFVDFTAFLHFVDRNYVLLLACICAALLTHLVSLSNLNNRGGGARVVAVVPFACFLAPIVDTVMIVLPWVYFFALITEPSSSTLSTLPGSPPSAAARLASPFSAVTENRYCPAANTFVYLLDTFFTTITSLLPFTGPSLLYRNSAFLVRARHYHQMCAVELQFGDALRGHTLCDSAGDNCADWPVVLYHYAYSLPELTQAIILLVTAWVTIALLVVTFIDAVEATLGHACLFAAFKRRLRRRRRRWRFGGGGNGDNDDDDDDDGDDDGSDGGDTFADSRFLQVEDASSQTPQTANATAAAPAATVTAKAQTKALRATQRRLTAAHVASYEGWRNATTPGKREMPLFVAKHAHTLSSAFRALVCTIVTECNVVRRLRFASMMHSLFAVVGVRTRPYVRRGEEVLGLSLSVGFAQRHAYRQRGHVDMYMHEVGNARRRGDAFAAAKALTTPTSPSPSASAAASSPAPSRSFTRSVWDWPLLAYAPPAPRQKATKPTAPTAATSAASLPESRPNSRNNGGGGDVQKVLIAIFSSLALFIGVCLLMQRYLPTLLIALVLPLEYDLSDAAPLLTTLALVGARCAYVYVTLRTLLRHLLVSDVLVARCRFRAAYYGVNVSYAWMSAVITAACAWAFRALVRRVSVAATVIQAGDTSLRSPFTSLSSLSVVAYASLPSFSVSTAFASARNFAKSAATATPSSVATSVINWFWSPAATTTPTSASALSFSNVSLSSISLRDLVLVYVVVVSIYVARTRDWRCLLRRVGVGVGVKTPSITRRAAAESPVVTTDSGIVDSPHVELEVLGSSKDVDVGVGVGIEEPDAVDDAIFVATSNDADADATLSSRRPRRRRKSSANKKLD
jgi:hypothetical protein